MIDHRRTIALLASLLLSQASIAAVTTPLVIQSETGPVVTSACLQLPGQQLPVTDWWKSSEASQIAPEFAAVMAAAAKQDRQAMRQTFDASWAAKSSRVEEQAGALLSQLRTATLRSVPYRVDQGNERIYFAHISSGTQTTWVPFVFRRGAERRWGYLPERGDSRWLPLILESLRAQAPTTLASCASADARLPALLPAADASIGLRFKASQPIGSAAAAPAAVQVVLKLRDAARKRDVNAYQALLTKEGAAALTAWLKKADAQEADRYFGAWDAIEPMWLLDLAPVSVVVLSDSGGQVRSVYTVERNGRIEVMNLSHLANADALLKSTDSPLLRRGADRKFFTSLQSANR